MAKDKGKKPLRGGGRQVDRTSARPSFMHPDHPVHKKTRPKQLKPIKKKENGSG
jgi:hypothetical protein